MATDILLQEKSVQVTGGDLSITQGDLQVENNLDVGNQLKAGTDFIADRDKLNFDLNGLVISDDKNSVRIRGGSITGRRAHLQTIWTKSITAKTIELGKGSSAEPSNPGLMKFSDGKGNEKIILEGVSGNIRCKDLQLDEIGSLKQIIQELRREIAQLKR